MQAVQKVLVTPFKREMKGTVNQILNNSELFIYSSLNILEIGSLQSI